MLQYILTQSARYSAAELAQMAIEGGCGWITLHLPDMTDDDIKAMLAEGITEMCREYGTFLTIDDRPDLAAELGIHGVRLSRRYFAAHPDDTPMGMRERLGPEAVIGIECADPTAVAPLAPADIDFVTIPADFDNDRRRAFVSAVRSGGCTTPIVAEGDFDSDDVGAVLATGVSGLATGRPVTDADDPVAAVGAIIDAIASYRP